MRTFKRSLALVLAIAMVLTTFGMTVVSAAQYNDTEGHWAESYINTWSGYGVIQGDGGYFRPDDAITRAEVAQVTDNVISYEKIADNMFTDVSTTDWFADAVLKLVAAGTLTGNGDGTMAPNNYMTREEAMTMLARAYGLTVENSQAGITQYADYQNISDYATGYVGAMTAAGYVGGYEDGTIRPKDYISRAEFVKIIDNMIKLYITEPGSYGPEYVGGIVMIKTGGVTLNGIVAGGVVVSPQVSGDVTITGSQVSGDIVNLSEKANVTSNTGNVTNPSATTKPNNIVIGGGGSGGGGNGSGTASLTVKFHYGENYGTVKTKSVTKGKKLSESSVPTPTESNWDGLWYTSKSAAEKCSGTTFDPTISAVNKNYDLYAGHISNSDLTNIEIAVDNKTDYVNVYVGDTLTATNLAPADAKNYVSYQWYRTSESHGTGEKISGATKSSYTATDADKGMYLKVVVTGDGDKYNGTIYDISSMVLAKDAPSIYPEKTTAAFGNDVATTVTLTEGQTIAGVKTESGEMLSADQYTFDAETGKLTISKDYLAGLTDGQNVFTIVVSDDAAYNVTFVVTTTGGPTEGPVPTEDPEPTATPVTPDEPTATPVTPDEPTATPVTPDKPTATPVTPDKPTATPVTPDKPTATPVTPDKPTATPVTPDKPTATPVTPDKPTATPLPTATVAPIQKYIATVNVTGGTAVLKDAKGNVYPLAEVSNPTEEPVPTATSSTEEPTEAPATEKPTMPPLTEIAESYTFIADNFNSVGTVAIEAGTMLDNGKVYSPGGNTASIKKKKSTINGTDYNNSMRLKGAQNSLVFKTAIDAVVTVYGETHAERVFAAGTTNGGVELGKGVLGSGMLTFNVSAGTTVYLSGVKDTDNTAADIYTAGFTVEPAANAAASEGAVQYIIPEGDMVTVDAIPTTAGLSAVVTVKGADGQDIAVSDNKFTMPGQNITADVTFSEAPATPEPTATITPEPTATATAGPIASATPAPPTATPVLPSYPDWKIGQVNDNMDGAAVEVPYPSGEPNSKQAAYVTMRNIYKVLEEGVTAGEATVNVQVYLDPAVAKNFRIYLENSESEKKDDATIFAEVANNSSGSVFYGPDQQNTTNNMFSYTQAGWYNFNIVIDYKAEPTITLTVTDEQSNVMGTAQMGTIAGIDTTLKQVRLVQTAAPAYFAEMSVTLSGQPTATPVPEPNKYVATVNVTGGTAVLKDAEGNVYPTYAPEATIAPTIEPTVEPSDAPTAEPSDAPTDEPAATAAPVTPVTYKYTSTSEIKGGNLCDGDTCTFVDEISEDIKALFADTNDTTKIAPSLTANYKNYVGGTGNKASQPYIEGINLDAGTYDVYYLGYNNEIAINATIGDISFSIPAASGIAIAKEDNNPSRTLKVYKLTFTATEALSNATLTFNTESEWLPDIWSVILTNTTVAANAAGADGAVQYLIPEGDVVTVEATPETAGQAASVTVTGADGQGVTVENSKFTMPGQNVTADVTFIEAPASSTPAPTAKPAQVIIAGDMTLNETARIYNDAPKEPTAAYTEEYSNIFGENFSKAGTSKVGFLGLNFGGYVTKNYTIDQTGAYKAYILVSYAQNNNQFALSKDGTQVVQGTLVDKSEKVGTNGQDLFIYTYDIDNLEAGTYEFKYYSELGQCSDFVAAAIVAVEAPATATPAPATETPAPATATPEATEAPTPDPSATPSVRYTYTKGATTNGSFDVQNVSHPELVTKTADTANKVKWTAKDDLAKFENIVDPAPITVGDITIDPLDNATGGASDFWKHNTDTVDGISGNGNPRPSSLSGGPTDKDLPTNGTVLKLTSAKSGQAVVNYMTNTNKVFTVIAAKQGETTGTYLYQVTAPSKASYVSDPIEMKVGYDYYVFVSGSKIAVGYVEFTPYIETTEAFAGDTIKVLPSANDGYSVDEVSYTPEDGNKNIVAQSAEGYTFSMPEANVEINVAFKEGAEPSATPAPTATAAPATETPAPSATVEPTEAPATETPAPTDAPVSTIAPIPAKGMTLPSGVKTTDKSSKVYNWNDKATDEMKAVFGDPLTGVNTEALVPMSAADRTISAKINVSAEQAGSYKLMVLGIEYSNRYYNVKVDSGNAIAPENTNPGKVALIEPTEGNADLTITTYDLGELTEGEHTISVISAANNSRDFFAMGFVKYTPAPATETPAPTEEPATATPEPSATVEPTEAPATETPAPSATAEPVPTIAPATVWTKISAVEGCDVTVENDPDETVQGQAYKLAYAAGKTSDGFSYDLLNVMENKPADLTTANGTIEVSFDLYMPEANKAASDFFIDLSVNQEVKGWTGGNAGTFGRLSGYGPWGDIKYIGGGSATNASDSSLYKAEARKFDQWVTVTYKIDLAEAASFTANYNNDEQTVTGFPTALANALYLNVQPSKNDSNDVIMYVKNVSAKYSEIAEATATPAPTAEPATATPEPSATAEPTEAPATESPAPSATAMPIDDYIKANIDDVNNQLVDGDVQYAQLVPNYDNSTVDVEVLDGTIKNMSVVKSIEAAIGLVNKYDPVAKYAVHYDGSDYATVSAANEAATNFDTADNRPDGYKSYNPVTVFGKDDSPSAIAIGKAVSASLGLNTEQFNSISTTDLATFLGYLEANSKYSVNVTAYDVDGNSIFTYKFTFADKQPVPSATAEPSATPEATATAEPTMAPVTIVTAESGMSTSNGGRTADVTFKDITADYTGVYPAIFGENLSKAGAKKMGYLGGSSHNYTTLNYEVPVDGLYKVYMLVYNPNNGNSMSLTKSDSSTPVFDARLIDMSPQLASASDGYAIKALTYTVALTAGTYTAKYYRTDSSFCSDPIAFAIAPVSEAAVNTATVNVTDVVGASAELLDSNGIAYEGDIPEGDVVEINTSDVTGYAVSVSVTAGGVQIPLTADNKFIMPNQAVTVDVTYNALRSVSVSVTGGSVELYNAADNSVIDSANYNSIPEGTVVGITATPDVAEQVAKITVVGATLDTDKNLFTVGDSDVEVNVEFVTPTKYNVNLDAYTNGSVSSDKATAAEGEKVTLTVAPTSGYVTQEVYVVDETQAAETITSTDITKYTFTMPASDVTIGAIFAQVTGYVEYLFDGSNNTKINSTTAPAITYQGGTHPTPVFTLTNTSKSYGVATALDIKGNLPLSGTSVNWNKKASKGSNGAGYFIDLGLVDSYADQNCQIFTMLSPNTATDTTIAKLEGANADKFGSISAEAAMAEGVFRGIDASDAQADGTIKLTYGNKQGLVYYIAIAYYTPVVQ